MRRIFASFVLLFSFAFASAQTVTPIESAAGGTVVPVTITGIVPQSGSFTSILFGYLAVPPTQLFGGLLSGVSFTLNVNGVAMTCAFPQYSNTAIAPGCVVVGNAPAPTPPPVTPPAPTPAGAEMSNSYEVCPEICHITAVSAPATFQLGIGSTWSAPFTAYTLPLVVNCGITADCALLGGDPISETVKQLNVKRQAVPIQITWTNDNAVSETVNGVTVAAGASQTTTVPAL